MLGLEWIWQNAMNEINYRLRWLWWLDDRSKIVDGKFDGYQSRSIGHVSRKGSGLERKDGRGSAARDGPRWTEKGAEWADREGQR